MPHGIGRDPGRHDVAGHDTEIATQDIEMIDYKPGDLVECIDDRPTLRTSQIMPELGRVYTVEQIRAVGDGYSVRLVELTPTCHEGDICGCGHCGWDARRFRKVLRRHDDAMAVLRALLDCPVRPRLPELV